MKCSLKLVKPKCFLYFIVVSSELIYRIISNGNWRANSESPFSPTRCQMNLFLLVEMNLRVPWAVLAPAPRELSPTLSFCGANLSVTLTLYPQTHTYSNFFPVFFLKNLFREGLTWSGIASDTCCDLLILLPLLPQCWAVRIHCHTCLYPGHCARQVLYQLSHTSNSLRFKNKSLATPGFLSQFSFLSFLVRFFWKAWPISLHFRGWRMLARYYCTWASRMPSQSLHFQ